MMEVDLVDEGRKKKGGSKAAIYVYVVTLLENMTFLSNQLSIVTYFSEYMNFSLVKSATMVTNFVGAASLLSVVGGIVCDTYISRFKATLLFGFVEILGYVVLAAQAHFDELRPISCKDVQPDQTDHCEAATGGQQAILLVGLYVLALGAGAKRPALSSLGGDQFDANDPEESRLLSSYFNWFMLNVALGACIGVTVLVWISENIGWDKSFGLCIVLLTIGQSVLTLGFKKFRHNVPKGSPLVRICQVLVVAVRNRNLPIPQKADKLHEIHTGIGKQKEILQPTDQFRFLDRAAIATELKAWRTCTVTQVEEVKILMRIFPLILTTVFMNTCMAQLQTLSVQQSKTLNRHISNFQIPGPSIQFLSLFTLFISIPIYDRVFVPFARRITGIPSGIPRLQRIGIGLLLSTVSMAVAAIIETKRKSVAFHYKMVDTNKPLPMTVFWLAPQYGIFGLANTFTMIGLLEFYYAEFSPGMKSFGASIGVSSTAIGYFLSTVLVNVVNKVTGGWLANSNLNRDKLNYFYWLLSGLSVVNFGFYLWCSSWYKYKKVGFQQSDEFVEESGGELVPSTKQDLHNV